MEKNLPQELHKQADDNARQCRKHHTLTKQKPLQVTRIHLKDADGEITGHEKQNIETNWTTYKLELYNAHQWQIPVSHLSQYDWSTYGKIFAHTTATIQKYMIKC